MSKRTGPPEIPEIDEVEPQPRRRQSFFPDAIELPRDGNVAAAPASPTYAPREASPREMLPNLETRSHIAGTPLSVVLADDNRMFREALLARIRMVVGEVEIREVFTATELFDNCAARSGRNDLFLVDIAMPELGGNHGLRELRRRRPDAMLIAIGCPADPAEARSALENGVSAYLLRSMGSEAFAAALSLVLNGERFFPASVMLEALRRASAQTAASIRAPEQQHASAGGGEGLTPRQLDVLRHLAVGKSNKEIARALGIQEITVKVHLQAIFARIGVSNRTQAAMHAERAGWFVAETDDDQSDIAKLGHSAAEDNSAEY